MNIATSVNGPARAAALPDSGKVVASFPTYGQAQRAVDHLSDAALGSPAAR